MLHGRKGRHAEREPIMMTGRSFRPGGRILAAILLVTFCCSVCPSTLWIRAAAAQPWQDLARASDHVDFAEYEEALAILDPLIASRELSGESLRDAYILTARSHAGLGHTSQAKEAFCQALRIDPQWRPDPVVFTNDEIELFDGARASCQLAQPAQPAGSGLQPSAAAASTPWYKKPVTWIAGGAAIVLGVLVLGGGGGGDGGEESLPDLPDFPEHP
jgi:hypothetical protein